MARFAEERNYRRGQKRRQAKESATQTPKPIMTVSCTARRELGAIKPTVEKSHGRHQRAYELDPAECDVRELAAYAEWERELDATDEAA